MTFPLPLVPFEEYMLVDDRPAYPMSFFLKLIFSGEFDRVLLDAALRTAIERHPLLSARVGAKKNRFEWVQVPSEEVAVRWMPDETPLPATPIDLFAEPGLRVSARRCGEETKLGFQFHHSCCDAMGGLQLVEDLMVGYAASENRTEPASFSSIDKKRLLGRGRFGLTPWKLLRLAPKQAKGLLGVRQFLMRQAVPLLPVEIESKAKVPDSFPSSCGHQFSEAETAGLLSAARRAGATVNDLLARDLFLALGDFRSTRRLTEKNDWLRLSVPINLRGANDNQLSAANVVSMVFLDRQPADLHHRKALLESIGQEMQLIKANRLGLTFPLSLWFARSLPGGSSRLRGICNTQTCRGTVVLSNLGRPLLDMPMPRRNGKIAVGKMTLERMEFLPPIRPKTVVAFGVFTYAGRLQVDLHFDRRVLSGAEGEGLLGDFVPRIRETASL